MSSDIVSASIQGSRLRGLSEATNMHYKASVDKSRHGGTYIHSHSCLAPESAPYQSSAQINGPHKLESSKALLSGDWRQRPSGDGKVHSSHVVNFTNHITKLDSKEDEKRKQKKLRVDTIAARSAGSSRRFRNQENSPLEPSMILSAPATSDEFSYAADGSAVDKNYEDKINYPKKRFSNNLILGPKHFVEMNSLHSPKSDGGYVYVSSGLTGISRLSTTEPDTSFDSSFGLAKISENYSETSTAHLSHETSTSNMKHVVQLQRVKNLNDLRIKPWDQLHIEILNLSPKMNWEIRCRSPPLSMYDESAQEKEDHNYTKSVKDKRDDNMGYQRILAKLQKNTIQDRRTTDPEMNSNDPSHTLKFVRSNGVDSDNHSRGQPIRPPDAKAKYNSFSEKARTLNPKAPEFNAEKKKKPATYHLGSPAKFVRPSVTGLFNQTLPTTQSIIAETKNQRMTSLPPINHPPTDTALHTRRMLIAAQLVQYLAKRSGTSPNSAEMGLIMELAGITNSSTASKPEIPRRDMVPLNLESGMTTTYFPVHHESIPGTYSEVSAPSNICSDRSGISQAAPFSQFATKHNPTFDPGATVHPLSLTQIRPGVLSMVPRCGPVELVTQNTHPLSNATSSIRQVLQPGYKDLLGKRPTFSKTTLFDARNIGTTHSSQVGVLPPEFFGPKPVSKPKGPPRPNDPRWNKQQQEYEAYLEWRRAYNPEYHQDCRDRQAKRADKNKLKEIKEQFKIPVKKNAAIKIEKPGETNDEDQEKHSVNND